MSSCSIIGVFFGNTSAIITGIPADILTSVYYLNLIPEFASYFNKRRPSTSQVFVRYETPAGKQAQLDWKESLKLFTTDGEAEENRT